MNTNLPDDGSVGRFREASMELDAAYSLFAKTCGLSVTEYWSLLLVSQGIRTQSELSAHLSISKQTLNSAVMLLKRKGLISLGPSESSQRVKIILLTGAGRQFIKEHISLMHQTETRAWESLSAEEQVTLTKLTQKFCTLLISALEQV